MHGTVLALGVSLLAIMGLEATAQKSVIIEYGSARLALENETNLCADMYDGDTLKMLTF
jgi:hypothetical protein